MDSALSAGILATDILGAVSKPIPLVGESLGTAFEALGKLLQAIENAEHNKQDLKDFGDFVKVELDKIKHAVDQAPVACRPELDARFAGITNLLNQATTDVEVLANQGFVKRVVAAQKAEDKLTELKDCFKQEVLSFLMMATNQVLENQRREQEEQSREREEQNRERERQRRESERALIEKLEPIITGTAQGRGAPSGCMDGTREELLNEFTTWATNPAGPCVLWLSGLAGTGKSSIAQSVAARLAEKGMSVVSFFISRHAHRRSDLCSIIHTLAFELARVHHAARASILQALERDPRIHELNLDGQVDQLLLQPLRAVVAADSAATTIIILDALDECDNLAGLVGDGCLAKIIPVLNESASLGKIKLLLTSRPLPAVGASIQPFVDRLGREVELHKIPTTEDIRTYLKRSLEDVHRPGLPSVPWPSVEDLDALVQRAGSFFIYAATVVRHIKQDQYTPEERLADLLNAQKSSIDEDSPYAEVDRLYLEVLSLFIGAGKQTLLTERVRRILSAVVLGREPMSMKMISDLLQIDVDAVRRIVSGLGAIWAVPSCDGDPIALYHASFPDFILDSVRCVDQRFTVISSIGHECLSTGCLRILNQQLVRDICQVPLPAGQELPNRASISDIEDRLAKHISPPLRYSTLHVLHHLVEVDVADCSEGIFDNLRMFCQGKLLFWLELTCLLGPASLSRLVVQLASLPVELMNQDKISECGVLLRQFAQAVQYFEEPLQASHAETYSSLLAFMPRNELFRAYADLDCFIKIVHADDWDYPANRALIRDEVSGGEPAISADGSVVACWRGGSILVWQNAARSSFYHAIPLENAYSSNLALDPSGKYLVVSRPLSDSNRSEISAWQLSGAEPILLRTRSFDERVLAISLDSRDMHVVYASQSSIGVLSLLDLMDVPGFNHEFPQRVSSAAFSAEGMALIAIGTQILISTVDSQWKPISYGPPGWVLSEDVVIDQLCVSQDGLTAAVCFLHLQSRQSQVWIHRRQSWGQSEVLSTKIDTDQWTISSGGRLIAVRDNDAIVVYRFCWQQTPHLERCHEINAAHYPCPLAFSSDDAYLVWSDQYLLTVQNIETDEVVYQHNFSISPQSAEILWQHRLLYVKADFSFDIVDMHTASANHHSNVQSVVVQSPTGMSAAVFETSQATGTVGRIWNLYTGTWSNVTAPQLTDDICYVEFTSDGSSIFVVNKSGMAIIPADEGLQTSVQYAALRQEHLEPYGVSLSGNEKAVAVIYRRTDEDITGQISVWDFPAFSRRRDFSTTNASNRSEDPEFWSNPVSLCHDGALIAWSQAQEICVARCDQPSERSHCRLPMLHDHDSSAAQSTFDSDSQHLVTTEAYTSSSSSATVRVWNLADLEAPVMVRSIHIDSTTLFLRDPCRFQSYYWNRKTQAIVSQATLEVSPYLFWL
ncbi:hypothetical protein BKA62DRAFT_306347 [Auriculariales sp. MPI-PUGE-AT-0066]|nr:hypothetical protein BKA62DRAFT_306347 [Auriculariales sp. MPI-PUGE-AT-0066]